jgi:hypothetical protein
VRTHGKRILFFPLSNVLGHLTRTFALAEAFAADGHEVSVAMNRTCSSLAKVLPSRIRVLPAHEMYASATQSFGPIVDYAEGIEADRANVRRSDRLTRAELRRRAGRLMQMVARDGEIVREVRPDAIITDYHFTAPLLELPPETRVFHISHIVGYPSLYRRATGADFFPLDRGHILVPGIRDIEYESHNAAMPVSQSRESVCGIFRWRGWQRLRTRAETIPPSDVFLSFGSTGNAKEMVPRLLPMLSARYRVAAVAPWLPRSGGHVATAGHLEQFLNTTRVTFCHGGHGTVMECILHKTPMVVFPHNIEQLEIGRRIEKLRLGILVERPSAELRADELSDIIERVRADSEMKSNLEHHSELLRRQNGPESAVSVVLRSLEDGEDATTSNVRRTQASFAAV